MKAARLWRLVLVLSLLLMAMGAPAGGQGSAVIVVDTTSDVVDCHADCTGCPCWGGYCDLGDLPGPDGFVSLREAVCVANTVGGPQVIEFDIPTSDPGYDGQTFTIRPHWVLQLVDDGTTMDGTTQPTLSNPYGPEIVLDGSDLTTDPGEGIGIAGSNNVVRGLAIHSFGGGSGIQLFEYGGRTPDNNVIAQCYIGTDATGTVPMGNQWGGVSLSLGRGNVIRDSIIAGNFFGGIRGAEGGGETLIEGNLIGTDRTGTLDFGNGNVPGVGNIKLPGGSATVIRGNLITGTEHTELIITSPGGGLGPNLIEDNRVGTDLSGENPVGSHEYGITAGGVGGSGSIIRRNIIAFSADTDLWVPAGVSGNTISENSIFGTGGELAIDLTASGEEPDGVTPNDPGDADTGANDLMNFPVLTSALATPGKLVVRGTIDTPTPETVVVEFFATEAGGNPSGHGGGKVFLGTKSPNPVGKITAALDPVEPGTLITATATDAWGNTSEFAANILATAPGG